MKPLIILLPFCFITNALFGQKKEVNPTIQPYWALSTAYSTASKGNGFSLNGEYQYRYKNIGIGAGFAVEYMATRGGSLGKLYAVGEIIYGWRPSGRYPYKSLERWANLAPSLLGYYYLGEKGNWEGFFKTGVVANYRAWYSYNGLEYKTDFMGKVIDAGLTPVQETINSVDLQTVNWLIGGGIQYKFNKTIALRMTSEVQWGRGISILGGFVFKI
jgi:hypothetical protein